MWKVPLFELNYDHSELEAVQKVLDSQWLTMGEKTSQFESRFGEFLGNQVEALSTSSGTAALHMALMAAGVGPGDEVIIPALTFVADLNVVLMTGANPVLVDCTSYHNWNISPDGIAKAITDRTKAVIVVHYAGYPCDMEKIHSAIQKAPFSQYIHLIEDVAHAPGADYRGRSCGILGDIGCFSFFSNKNLSVGEGGMYVTSSEELLQKGRYLRSHGMTSLTLDRHKGRTVSYDVVCPGFNYRMDEIRAALGLVQLEKLTEANKKRAELVNHYRQCLKKVDGILIPFTGYDQGNSSFHIFTVLLNHEKDRLKIMKKLKENGIQSSIHYPPFQNFSAFRDLGLNLTPIAYDISQRELTLPLYPTMSFEQVELVCEILKKALQ